MSTFIERTYHLMNTGIVDNDSTATIDMSASPAKDYCFTIERTDGATDTIDVDFDASLDNTTWFTLATITDVSSDFNSSIISNKPYRYVRYYVNEVGSDLGNENTLAVQILAT